MPFAQRGPLQNKDVFAPEVVAETLVPIILAEQAQLSRDEKGGIEQSKLSEAQLAIIEQHRVGQLAPQEIKAICSQLESSGKSGAKELSADFRKRYSQQAVNREYKEDPRGNQDTITVKRLWFFKRQQSIDSFISDLLSTPPIFFGGNRQEGFHFAFSAEQIKKIQLIANQLNQNQLEKLMGAVNYYFLQQHEEQFTVVTPYGEHENLLAPYSRDELVSVRTNIAAALKQQLKEQLLMRKLLSDKDAAYTYESAYRNRNDSLRPWLGVTAHNGNKTLVQLINDMVDHITIDANGQLIIKSSMQEIIDSISTWKELKGSTKTFITNEVEKVFFRRLNTQFHFTSSKAIVPALTNLKHSIEALLTSKPIPPADFKEAARQTPGNVELYLKPYYFLGLIRWGNTPVTVAEFTKKLFAHNFDWNPETNTPQFSKAQINQLKSLNTELVGGPDLKRVPVDALKQQIEATLISRIKNGTIQFGRQKAKITKIQELSNICNELNQVINNHIPNAALPPAQQRGASALVNENKAPAKKQHLPVRLAPSTTGKSKNPFDSQSAEPNKASQSPEAEVLAKFAEIKDQPFDTQINTLIEWAESVVNKETIQAIINRLKNDSDRVPSEEKQQVYKIAIAILELRKDQLDLANDQKLLDDHWTMLEENLKQYRKGSIEYEDIKSAMGDILMTKVNDQKDETGYADDIAQEKLELNAAIEAWKKQGNPSQSRTTKRPAILLSIHHPAMQRTHNPLSQPVTPITPISGRTVCGSFISESSVTSAALSSRDRSLSSTSSIDEKQHHAGNTIPSPLSTTSVTSSRLRSGSQSSRTSNEDGETTTPSPLSISPPDTSPSSLSTASSSKKVTGINKVSPPSPLSLSIPAATPSRRNGSALPLRAVSIDETANRDSSLRKTPPSPLSRLSVMASSSHSNGNRASMASSADKRVAITYTEKHKLFAEMLKSKGLEYTDYLDLLSKTLLPLYKKHEGNLTRTINEYRDMVEERKKIPASRLADSISHNFRFLASFATEVLTGTVAGPLNSLSTFNDMEAEDQIKTLHYYVTQDLAAKKNRRGYNLFTDNGKYLPHTEQPKSILLA